MEEAWRYGRNGPDGLECAEWQGRSAPALAPHFHSAVQLTRVTVGERRFLTSCGPLSVQAGQAILLPAGMPHRSLSGYAGPVQCENLYLPPDSLPAIRRPLILASASDVWQAALSADQPQAVPASEEAKALCALVGEGEAPIAVIAAGLGLSREEFTRRFHRGVGLPPQAWRIAHRLDLARTALRRGAPLADTAADAGFSDQSHLGRRFRAAFGITPGRYRRALAC